MSDRAEREKQLDWLYRLKSDLKIFIPKDFHLAEFEQSLDYAISSIKTDLKYDLLYEETKHIADADKMMGSTTKNNLAVDCISREQALNEFCIYNSYDSIGVDKVRSYLKALPSVTPQEPQTFKWCDTCKEYDQEKHCCHRYSKVIRNAVAEIEQEPVLDKLRAEIEQLSTTKCTETHRIYVDADDFKENVLAILDKYKAESEG